MKRCLPVAAKFGGGGLLVAALSCCIACGGAAGQAAKLADAGQYEQALASYEQTVAAKPGTVDARKAQLAIAQIQIADLGDPVSGLATYQSVVDAAADSEEGLAAGYAIGVHHFGAEEYALAAAAFQAVVQAGPTSETAAEAQIRLAMSQERSNDLEAAQQTYAAYSQLHSDTDAALMAIEKRAQLLDQLGKKSEAIAERQRVVRDYGAQPSEAAAPIVELAREGLLAAGAEVPAPITAATRSDATLRREALDRVRDRDRPASARRASAERAEANVFGVDAGALMNQMNVQADDQGTMYDAMFSLANAMFYGDQFKEAGALYQGSIEMAEAEVGMGWENMGAAYKALADVYRKLGLDDHAAKALTEAIRKNPDAIDQIIASGQYDYGVENYQAAIDTWSSIAGMKPGKDSEIYYKMGLAYKHLKNTPAEVDSLERSLGASPANKDAAQSMAEVLYYRAGQRSRSYLFQDVVDDKGGWPAYLELGKLGLKHGYYLSAQQQFNIGARIATKVAETSPDEGAKLEAAEAAAGMSALKAIVKGRRNADLLDEAALELAPVAEANPENALVRYAAGLHAVDRGDVDTATAEFTKAMELTPRDSTPVHALANLHVSQGFLGAAVELYSTFLERNPRDKAVQQRRDLLQAQAGTPAATTPTAAPAAPTPGPTTPAAPTP
ncbi:tetratricopeptide repeat protein [Candidatus Poribacteria bacterium]|nr:tetratricopeptide repeat protein [Candidatus Poribacteria bacterium]MBT5534459.1 tetratricopeptide repeat protein [Candidatus Poribacteria bacterium]MBT5712774.1 tetratricopeptide repeat protein [Candidatus Poribacteria bacterium]MBT7097905.1 tetratricopeptide repeat protein [Candidatus Poribacteria bacterium]MBT7805045.1 tetratricopeptide repeat protein [Candidatus Poribacteria bacterium]